MTFGDTSSRSQKAPAARWDTHILPGAPGPCPIHVMDLLWSLWPRPHRPRETCYNAETHTCGLGVATNDACFLSPYSEDATCPCSDRGLSCITLIVRRGGADVGQSRALVSLDCKITDRDHAYGLATLYNRKPANRALSHHVHRGRDGVIRRYSRDVRTTDLIQTCRRWILPLSNSTHGDVSVGDDPRDLVLRIHHQDVSDVVLFHCLGCGRDGVVEPKRDGLATHHISDLLCHECSLLFKRRDRLLLSLRPDRHSGRSRRMIRWPRDRAR